MPEGVVSDVLLGSLGSFESSNIILPSPSRPYQWWSVTDMPSHSSNIGKKEKKNYIGLLFIWTIIDHSFAPLIGCYKQPVKYADLSILVICEKFNTFYILIVRDYSFTQWTLYSLGQWPGRPAFNPRLSHTKDSENGTWCHLA